MKLSYRFTLFPLIAFVLFSTATCSQDDFDVRGEWEIDIIVNNQYNVRILIFSGGKESGNVELKNVLSSGTYSVSGNFIRFYVTYGASSPHYQENYTGHFTTGNKMSGDYAVSYKDQIMSTGTWRATR